MAEKMKLPDCGMYIGVPVYLDRGDYVFQSTGLYYTSWVSEDHDPEWYLDKIVDDNQGNIVVFWDGGASKRQLKSMAYLLDLAGAGIKVPDPDWENGKYLTPDDFPPCQELKDTRMGAGFYKFVTEAEKRGLHVYSIYADATPEWTEKIVSNPMFLGYNAGEAFSFGSGFCKTRITANEQFTLTDAANAFGTNIKEYFRVRKENGWKKFLVTSASFHLDFEIASGGTDIIPHMEGFAFAHLNFGMSLCRGIYKQCDLSVWGCYLAHEHYSFMPYASPLRSMMLDAAYYLSYLNGSKISIQECGSWWQQSDHITDTKMHDVPKIEAGNNDPHTYKHLVPEARKHYPNLNYDSAPCREYRRSVSDFYNYLKKNGTPEGQPEVNFAVLKGRYDFCSGSYCPNYCVAGAGPMADINHAWFESTPEYGWEIFKKAILPLNDSFGDYKNNFFSGTPYGLCDIVGLVAPGISAEYLLKHYKALMFTGWNSAKEEDYQLLLDYVRGGGLLFISIPHLSKNVTRNFTSYGVEELVNGGDFTELAGIRVKGRGKSFYWSLARDKNRITHFPWNQRYGVCCTHLGDIEVTGEIEPILVDDESFAPFLFRHRCGKGEVFFMNSWEYPGAYGGELDWAPGSRVSSDGATGEIYKYLAKRARGTAYITETEDGDDVGENCKKITFSYFPSTDKVYMMNCDFATERTVYLHFKGEIRKITLKPTEFSVIG